MIERDKINVIVANLEHKPAMAQGLIEIYDGLISDGARAHQEIASLKQEKEELNLMIKEAISLPKGVEPHSYSDYLNK